MERRAASHTEEEEMNQRRRLLNAAKKGDQKAVAKLFELYQVRVYNNDMVSKLNRAASTHKLQAKLAQNKLAQGKQSRGSTAKHASIKPSRTPVQASHAVKNKNGGDRKHAPKKHKK
ncbi:hypothetical protein W02_04350 [Nitrospira sp. KM1]|uniref:hypothetical protein n=1 Tax=Nitrospira sp. KM1 TaxID=1936990 RepID=UPI0013A7B438|nr:hypothetical protein [Nitrospira sp. KM1]BCA53295.1 hypothetical protein W02_04350 [Nitrospira sp. KM1]